MKVLSFLAVFCLALSSLLAQGKETAGPPFSEEHLLNMVRSIKMIGEEQLIDFVEKRGVDFRLTEAFRRTLKRAGAGDALVAAVAKASAEWQKRLRQPDAPSALAAPPPEKPVVLPPPLDRAGQTALLEEARTKALEYTKNLPSFICLQVTKRHEDFTGRGDWRTVDVIQARLAYDRKGESYQVITVNNQLTDRSMESLGGSTSTGEFGSLLFSLFAPETEATFQWERQAAVRERPVEVYSYAVVQERSNWHIVYNKVQTVIPAYRGRVWVDRASGQTLRITFIAVDIPKDFPVRVAETTLDYDWAEISGQNFLLPARAAVLMSEARAASRNEIEFRSYRKFSTETKITFDTPP